MIRYWEQSKRINRASEQILPLLEGEGVPEPVKELLQKAAEALEDANEAITVARAEAKTGAAHGASAVPAEALVEETIPSHLPLAESEVLAPPHFESVAPASAAPAEEQAAVTEEPEEELPVIEETDLDLLLPGSVSEEDEEKAIMGPWLPGELTVADLKGLRYIEVEHVSPEDVTVFVRAWPAITSDDELSWAHVGNDGRSWKIVRSFFAAYVLSETGEPVEEGAIYAAHVSDPGSDEISHPESVFSGLTRLDPPVS